MSEPRSDFRTTRRVEFADTDMGNLVHFSRFFVFMQTTEHEFLHGRGATVHFEHEARKLAGPVDLSWRALGSHDLGKMRRLAPIVQPMQEHGDRPRRSHAAMLEAIDKLVGAPGAGSEQ